MPRLFPVFVVALALAGNLSAFAADSLVASDVVPFKLHRGHIIVVKCSIGSLRDVTAIVDTGTSETVVDMEVVRKLSLAIQPDRATFVAQQAMVWAVAIPSLQLGSVSVARLDGIATDLSSLTAKLGIRPQVLIGMDVLRRSSFLIDYHAHRLIFGPPPRLAHSALLRLSGEFGLRFAVIESTILGHSVRLQVDTGFDSVLLYQGRIPGLERDRTPGVAALGPAAVNGFASGNEDARIANAAQSFSVHSFPSPDVLVGAWHAPHAQISVVDGSPPESAEFDGLIGAAFLSRQKVAFDFENGMISWE